MYSIVTVGNSTMLYTWNLLKVDLKHSHTEICEMMDVLIDRGNHFSMFTYVKSHFSYIHFSAILLHLNKMKKKIPITKIINKNTAISIQKEINITFVRVIIVLCYLFLPVRGLSHWIHLHLQVKWFGDYSLLQSTPVLLFCFKVLWKREVEGASMKQDYLTFASCWNWVIIHM